MSDPVKKKKGVRHLDPKRRSDIISMWKSGQFTLEQIAARVGTHKTTVVRIIKVSGAKKGETAEIILAKAKEKLEIEQQSEVEAQIKRIKETRNSAYKMLDAFEKLVAVEITTARNSKQEIGTRINNFKTLHIGADIILKSWRGRAEILGIADQKPDDMDIPDLNITEMTNEQIREMQRKQAEFDNDSLLTDMDDAIENEDNSVAVPDGVLREESIVEPITPLAEDELPL